MVHQQVAQKLLYLGWWTLSSEHLQRPKVTLKLVQQLAVLQPVAQHGQLPLQQPHCYQCLGVPSPTP